MSASDFDTLSSNELTARLADVDTLSERASIFQSPAWISFWDAQPGFSSSAVALFDGENLRGYFPFCTRKGHAVTECYSMPMGTYGGAVALDNSSDTSKALTSHFLDRSKQNSVDRINVIDFNSCQDELYEGFKVRELTTHVLELGVGTESLSSALSEGHRRNIRKCDDGDLIARRVRGADDVAAYYSLIEESAKRHGTKPIYNLDFYLSLLECVPDEFLLWELACLDDEPCAAHIYFRWGKSVSYWDGASNEAGLEMRANYYLFWKNILIFESEGVESLNFGSSPSDAVDLVRFKRGWGAKEVVYFEYDWSSATYRGMKQIKDWLR